MSDWLARSAIWRRFWVVTALAAFAAITVTATALAWLTRLALFALLAMFCGRVG